MKTDFDDVVGKRVLDLMIERGGESYARFVTDAGNIDYGTEGDCCSVTWFSDVIAPQNIRGQVVERVEALDLPNPTDERERSEEDRVYGHRFHTALGYCDIIYRNASNGYYGGSCFRVKSVPNDAESRLASVETDFTA